MESLTQEFVEVFNEEKPSYFEVLVCMGSLPVGVEPTESVLVKIAKATRRLRQRGYEEADLLLSEEDIDTVLTRWKSGSGNQEGSDGGIWGLSTERVSPEDNEVRSDRGSESDRS